MIVADPAPTAVTSPVADTVAAAALDELHVMTRPVNTLPSEAFVTAVSCTVSPTFIEGDDGVTVTELTGGGFTVTDAVPVLPSDVAVIVADPALTAVTSPVADTVAVEALDELQLTGRPVRTLPWPSVVAAVS